MTTKKKPEFRLFDFQVDNTTYDEWNDEPKEDNKKFLVKMFAMNEKGKTYCIYVKGFRHFLCNSNIELQWIPFSCQKMPIFMNVKNVTFHVAKKVIGINMY